MLKNTLLIFAWMSLAAGCATVPSAPQPTKVEVICPRLPALEPLDPETQAALERDFIGQMRDFLSGSLPTQPDYKLRSDPAGRAGQGIKPP